MRLPGLVVFSAKGKESFSCEQRRRLEACASVRYVSAPDRLDDADICHALHGARFAGLTPRAAYGIRPELLLGIGTLEGIALPTTGYEWLDTSELVRGGIRVSHVPDFSSTSCAEFTLGLLISLARHLPLQRLVPTRTVAPQRGMELHGKTLGVIGLGSVGEQVALLGRAFGMRVLGFDIRMRDGSVAERVPLESLLTESHAVSLHLPLDAATRHLVDAERIAKLRDGALVINTARPDLVEPDSMLAGLHSGKVGGYAFDIGYHAPGRFAALSALPTVIAVPHISWYTNEAIFRETEAWVSCMASLVEGAARNLIEP